jgi:chemotaxis protein MotB
MASRYSRRRDGRVDYWPGFVDALATLLLVIIFLLSVFMLSQFFLTKEITGKDNALSKLNAQIAELTELLALERALGQESQSQIGSLQASLTASKAENSRLQGTLDQGAGAGAGSDLLARLDQEKALSQKAAAQVDLLNQQIAALRRQLAALEAALDASEAKDKESQTKLADLGQRLNLALAQRVQELQRYRSDFFGRLREILGNRADMRVVGDRFVFQSEVLFPVGQDTFNDEGRKDLDKLAAGIVELEKSIPPEISWTLRVDGHTDARPISNTAGRFRSNWELSAARAIAVVRFLIEKGVSPKHLVAAGFGEFQPLEEGTSEEIMARNRRIELKLTDR